MKERVTPGKAERAESPDRRPSNRAGSRASLLRLQASAGNRATADLVRTEGSSGALGSQAVQRATVTVGGEQVEVSLFKKKKEKAEAETILKEIKDKYGISLSSTTTVEAIKAQYDEVPAAIKKGLRTRRWRMIELRALHRALAFYAPILGAERANSTRKDADQEVTSVGKVKQSIDENTKAGELDTTTLGEFFRAKKNMGLFKASENYKADFKDEGDQLTGTFIHEIAHGLLEYALPDFIKETGGYWRDSDTESGKKGAEAPITDYGATNAAEDLCESAMMFFIAPDRLKGGDGATAGKPGNPCPLRHAFMAKIGKDWVPPPVKTPLVEEGKPATPPQQEDAPGKEGAPPSPGGSSTPPVPAPGPDSGPGVTEVPLEGGEILISGPDPETAPGTETSAPVGVA
jgi:hypothetical protein